MAADLRTPPEAKLAFGALLFLAGTAGLLDVGAIGWLVTPICILLGWFAIFRAPLRITMLTLMFFALVLENPAEIPASGQWESPLFKVGGLFLTHFKTIVGGPWFFGGMDLMLLGASVVWYLRGPQPGGIATPRPMIKLAQLCYVTIAFTWLVGMWHGGTNPSYGLWQVDRVMYLPLVFLLCQAAFTAPKDYLAVGKVALVAAMLRAAQATYVRLVVPATFDPIAGESSLPYTTTHHDSMLFAFAAVMLAALIMQRVDKAVRLALLCGPLLVSGMLANDRRMVWVQIILVGAAVYLITDTNAGKRKLQRVLLLLAPLVAGYVAAGWGSKSGVFAPVALIRSAVDSSSDGSTAWRDLENFNLIFTLKQFPIVGTGYGRGFWEIWPMPMVAYDLEHYIPHNSILGLWCYGGLIGFTGITLLWVGGIYFSVLALHRCKDRTEKAAALVSFGSVIVYYLQCFGDMGLGSWTGIYLIAPALAISCKLAVKSGAWTPEPVRRTVRSGYARRSPRAAE